MPMSLQENVFDIVHKSCLGVFKTKQRLRRSKVYWKSMDQDISHSRNYEVNNRRNSFPSS